MSLEEYFRFLKRHWVLVSLAGVLSALAFLIRAPIDLKTYGFLFKRAVITHYDYRDRRNITEPVVDNFTLQTFINTLGKKHVGSAILWDVRTDGDNFDLIIKAPNEEGARALLREIFDSINARWGDLVEKRVQTYNEQLSDVDSALKKNQDESNRLRNMPTSNATNVAVVSMARSNLTLENRELRDQKRIFEGVLNSTKNFEVLLDLYPRAGFPTYLVLTLFGFLVGFIFVQPIVFIAQYRRAKTSHVV